MYFTGFIRAQKSIIRFQHYTSEQGLSQNMIDYILKDHKGFMWFATWNGLNRFDGYNFIVYKHNQSNSNSLSNNFVHTLCQDKFDNIWIGTEKGLNVYLYEENRFVNYSAVKGNNYPKFPYNIETLNYDSKGKIWIGTLNNGLFRIQIVGKNGQIAKVDSFSDNGKKGSLKGNIVNFIYEDKKGNIWIGTNRGLNRFNNDENNFTNILNDSQNPNSLSDNNVQAIYRDRLGYLWIGTNFGLNRINLETYNIIKYYFNPDDPMSLSHNTVKDITEDISGNLVIGTLGGISIYNRIKDDFINYTYKVNDKYGLNNGFVNSLYADNEGNVWIGTEKGGINKYNIYQKKFEFFESELGNFNSLSHNTINSILEDEQNIWIGTAGGGLNKYNKNNCLFTHYYYDAHNPNSISSNNISAIYRDRSGILWIGTWGGGLQKLLPGHEESGIFKRYINESGNNNSLINTFISSITEDKWGNLWIGTFEGLDRMDPSSEKFMHFTSIYNGIRITRVGCLSFDNNNNLWVGTENGLFKISPGNEGKIDLQKSAVNYFINDTSNRHTINGNYIISICCDKKGNLWFGTYGYGLNKLIINPLTVDDVQFISYTEADGLANNVIYGILEDNRGNLWLSTDNGLSRFNPLKKEFKNYYVADGLQSNQFYWSAYFKNKSGKMYFGGMNGLNAFYPDSIQDDKFTPYVAITNFKIYNQSVEVGKKYNGKVTLEKSISNTDSILLSYKSNEFSFEFSSLHFNQPDKNEYFYKLEGFDDNWIRVNSTRRFASYTNLKGGKYTFMVKASNNDGVWGDNSAKIDIIIIPPFWATWWFRIFLVSITILLIITYNRYRLFALEKQKRKLEILVTERTSKIVEQKEQLLIKSEHLKESNIQLEKRQEQIEGQKEQLEQQNIEILEQRDRLIDLNKKVQAANQQRLNFFTNISHEFRTPLTLIISPLEQLLREFKEDIKTWNRLVLINKNAQRLMHLINQLMDLRKVETGKMELKLSRDDIVSFIDNISQSFSNLAVQRNIQYIKQFNPKSIITLFDREKLENIIYNILSNAFKYTPEGGTITISTSMKECSQQVFLGVAILEKHFSRNADLKEYIEIKISDTGVGIEPEKINEIFKKFYRIPSSISDKVQGTGIGLSLAKELVKVHKGLLFVESKPNQGSIFTILLASNDKYLQPGKIVAVEKDSNMQNLNTQVLYLSDLLKNEIEDSSVTGKGNILKQSNKPLVLIVEDNNDFRSFLQDSLSSAFNIIGADDGKKGIEMAIKYIPDLIISDIIMPEVDGLGLCSILKNEIHTSHIPIILLTARSSVEYWIEGFDTGADDYIPKPFNIRILEARISNLIESRKKLKKLFVTSLITIPKEITTTRTDEQFLHRVLKIVEEHVSDSKFGVQELVSEMCMSRSLLHKKLTAIVDQSANDFITSIRLKKSALMLVEGQKNISNIALDVGFTDPKYFSRCFKKHFNVSPSEYMNNGSVSNNSQSSL